MRLSRRLIGYFVVALSFLGFGSVAYADSPSYHYARHVVTDQGSFGLASARFKAEQAYAVSMDSVKAVLAGGLVSDGNGYLQARADRTIGQGVGNQVAIS